MRNGPRGQPLPLHRLPQHRRRGASRARRRWRQRERPVIPAAFSYARADSVDEAVALLAEHGDDAKLLAGGHSLLPLMKLRLATPSVLVDVGRLDRPVVRARRRRHARHRRAHPPPRRRARPGAAPSTCRCSRAAAGEVGDPQVRHRGTLGGSLAHGDPASDLPAVVLALRGSIVVRGTGGERTIAADDFFRGFLETALAPDEIITEVRVPKTGGAGWAFEKFNRRAQDWAIVGVAAVGGDQPGVALVNMGSTRPVRASAVEAALRSGASPADAAARAGDGTDPPSDLNASPEYRRHLARVLVGRALDTVAAREEPDDHHDHVRCRFARRGPGPPGRGPDAAPRRGHLHRQPRPPRRAAPRVRALADGARELTGIDTAEARDDAGRRRGVLGVRSRLPRPHRDDAAAPGGRPPALARDRVRFVGDTVAVVVAETQGAGGRRRRGGDRRLRPAARGDRHGGGARARRAAAVRGDRFQRR